MQQIHFGLREFFYIVTLAGVVAFVARFEGAEIVLLLVFVSAGLLIAVLRGNARMREQGRTDSERPD